MEAGREIGVMQDLSERFGLGRWVVFESAELCAGCQYLSGRVLFAFEGPRPPLHPNCRCGRLPVKVAGVGGVALIRLVLEARGHGRAARFLEEEAIRRRDADRARRMMNALVERHPKFAGLQEAFARAGRR